MFVNFLTAYGTANCCTAQSELLTIYVQAAANVLVSLYSLKQ